MRLQCNNCKEIHQIVSFSGWVLKVIGAVSLDEDGRLLTIGPLNAISTVAKGKELTDSHDIEIICPVCKYTGPIQEFTQLHTCVLTGLVATEKFDTIFGSVYLHADVLPEADAIFKLDLFEWEKEAFSFIERILRCVD